MVECGDFLIQDQVENRCFNDHKCENQNGEYSGINGVACDFVSVQL